MSRFVTRGATHVSALIDEHREEIAVLCRRFGVARLEVFGSACTSEFDPASSDIDFLVTYPPDYDFGPWLARFQDLEAALAELLGRDVDLVMTSALNNRWFRREADKTRAVVYDASKIPEVA
jgi:predicted nucleotidyltransferase